MSGKRAVGTGKGEAVVVARCRWAASDPVMARYHDEEWGVPVRDPRTLWEMLMLEGFQAGLSWATILKRREGFRRAFAEFDPNVVARFGPTDVTRLMADPGIIRSRAKIEATIRGAQVYLAMAEEGDGLAELAWASVGGRTVRNTTGVVEAQTERSAALSKALKARGFKFVGPVIVHAWMQAVGLVDDHEAECFARSKRRRRAP